MLRICLGLVLVAAAASAQGAADRPTFEVASVRPAKPGKFPSGSGGPGTKDPRRFRATNASLTFLVMRAYHLVFPDQLSAPAWMDDAEFDVVANAPPGTTAEQLREMLQNLLADRFHMRVHHETRVLPVYELTVAKNGPKLKPAAPGSGTDDFVPGSRPRQVDRSGFPILPPGRTNVACWNVGTNVHCTYRVETMEALVQKLNMPTAASRHVIDKTGLTGRYDFTLYYRRADGPPPGSDNAPTIEQAVQEQLGVKLVPSKASVDVLVIDHAEKTPTQN